MDTKHDWESELDGIEESFPMATYNWSPEDWKSYIRKLITAEHKKEKADWLRSEIEKLEGMKQPITIDDRVESAFASIEWDRYNEALTTIITRYKEELKELESKI